MCTSPAESILDEFEQAKQEVKKDQSCAILWAQKVQAYPHGFLTNCSTVLATSKGKVAEWLDKYMFRDLPAKKRPGKRIANWLGNAKIHKTHGRPITIECAENQGLKVIALKNDAKLQDRVLSVFHAPYRDLHGDELRQDHRKPRRAWDVSQRPNSAGDALHVPSRGTARTMPPPADATATG